MTNHYVHNVPIFSGNSRFARNKNIKYWKTTDNFQMKSNTSTSTYTGNISIQKFEIQRTMKKFLKIITESRPNKETIEWRTSSRPKIVQHKHGLGFLERQKIEKENEKLKQNLINIATREGTCVLRTISIIYQLSLSFTTL